MIPRRLGLAGGALLAVMGLTLPLLGAGGGGGGGGGERAEEKKSGGEHGGAAGGGGGEAAEAAKAAPEPSEEARPPLPPLRALPDAVRSECRDEEMLVLRDLRGRALELDRREAELAGREQALKDLEGQLGSELDRLDGIRKALLEDLQKEKQRSQERTAVLAKMVDTMKAQEAAPVLAGIDEDLALDVLRRLKPKQAGKVLGAMDEATARRLSERMATVPDPRRGAEETDGASDSGGRSAGGATIPGREQESR